MKFGVPQNVLVVTPVFRRAFAKMALAKRKGYLPKTSAKVLCKKVKKAP